MRDVYVVKHAIATSLGNSLEATWQRLLKGHSALDAIHHFHAGRLTSQKACCILDLLPAAGENRVCALTRRVLDQITPVPPGTCVVWTGIKGNAEYIEADQSIEMPYLPEHYHRWVAERLGTAPIGFDINAACASSTVGMAVGAQKIARGEYGSVLVCAADVVTRFTFTGFSALKALTPAVCRPFDQAHDGMCIGDGAAAILLADAETARRHQLERVARLSGWGISNDANHITGPSRDGAGLVTAIDAAMRMAGLSPQDTQAFCAHGTGTIFNDRMELAAIETVFGDRRFPVFSIKGAVGHTLGAAGGIEAAICAHALAHKLIPPTAGLQTPESKAVGRVSPQSQAFDGRNILTSNSGFGGVNAALVMHAVPI
ncbi:MAG TPA: beta-ketoacyl synthase N-terminal-like domain-containing protein [Desulfobacterales bacterium]|nr:beta-ketoacyl synthase N-terminal-like domain-containing protein [Desulfobacterales bacterium]